MPTVNDILTAKGSRVHQISDAASVLEATHLMNQEHIGAVIAQGADGSISGIFTERDVLTRVVADQRDPQSTTIADVMTADVICCNPGTDIESVRTIMKTRRIRHLPVVDDDGRLKGLVSIGDINAYLAHEDAVAVQHLHDYIYGRA